MKSLIGIDEVGRGPWAGPLVAAAVELGGPKIIGIKDSKQLSVVARNVLANKIKGLALQIGIGWVSPAEIDQHGLSRATSLAMKRALRQLKVGSQEIIIDGNIDYLAPDYSCRSIVKADQTVAAVSAASIIAKVARDSYMCQLAKLLPQYGFEAHVGYGTARHKQALQKMGISIFHRQSFQPIAELISD